MLGAIIGDIAGSRFEFNNHRSTDFDIFGPGANFTDDTILTIATADALLNEQPFKKKYLYYGRKYPSPMGGYGCRFGQWLHSSVPEPYDSFGNGAAMRVSPCGFFYRNNREMALSAAAESAMCTHNHPEGVKGAMAVADVIVAAYSGKTKYDIAQLVRGLYYDLDETVNDIRGNNVFNETCQICVPQAITCFLESDNFESAIKLAVSIGGDSDTIAAITGGIAEAYYGIPEQMMIKATNMLPVEFRKIISKLYQHDER